MVKLRRQFVEVDNDRRNNQRIEFHYPVVILGIDENAQILDFSLEGFHIELSSDIHLAVGRNINLALKLPDEKSVLNIRARVTYQEKNGIGCKLVDGTTHIYDSLERCFSIFNSTLPLE